MLFRLTFRLRERLMRAMRALALALLLVSSWSAAAMVGGAAAPPDAIARSVVLIVGSRGNFCTGAALAPDLVLTAAHCVLPGADYKIVEYDSRGSRSCATSRASPRIRSSTSRRCSPTGRPRTWPCSGSPLH